MKKVLFVHILWHDGTVHNVPFTKGINTNKTFNKEDHIFITPHEKVYNELKEFENVYLMEDKHLLDKAYEMGEWIIVHALNIDFREFLKTDRKVLKKTIVRTWGHDINNRFCNDTRKGLKPIVSKILYRYKLRQVYMFAGDNKFDKANVKKYIGEKPFSRFSYFGKSEAEIALLNNLAVKRNTSETIRIMVGHSGFKSDIHVEILKRLKRFCQEQITVVLPLSYGDPQYIEEVKKYVADNFKGKSEVIEQFMEYGEYIKFLSNIDLAILPQLGSTSLGNFDLLTKLRVPLVLNKNGVFYDALKEHGIDIATYDDFDTMNLSGVIDKSALCSEKLFAEFGRALTQQDVFELQQDFFDTLEDRLK